jgi:Na+/H+ antiporter NhaD/arsenite permease-like protein
MSSFILLIFVVGYILIAFEHKIAINKAATALLTGVFCWWIIIQFGPGERIMISRIYEILGDISGILFFLFGAMTIVKLIDAHNGFDIVVRFVKAGNKLKLLWIVTLITFFLSPMLDNLTTTIVMISILHKLLPESRDRLYFTAAIVIAANAGGAWSPIGDVTTTMLWIGGQLTVKTMILGLFLPSIAAIVIPLIIISYEIKNDSLERNSEYSIEKDETEKKFIFFSGIILLLLVPVFKTILHLPPFMCMLISLSLFWIISELMHKNKSDELRTHLSVARAIQRIDMASIVFFLGILLAVFALEESGLLHKIAMLFTGLEMGHNSIAIILGFLSAIIDNVPLVAAAMGMFPIDHFVVDHHFWTMLAFTSGTGGSMLIIGSAAGVIAMGLEKIEFFWYLRKISWIALSGYFGGILILILQQMFFG